MSQDTAVDQQLEWARFLQTGSRLASGKKSEEATKSYERFPLQSGIEPRCGVQCDKLVGNVLRRWH
jgi:hypothetical protein